MERDESLIKNSIIVNSLQTIIDEIEKSIKSDVEDEKTFELFSEILHSNIKFNDSQIKKIEVLLLFIFKKYKDITLEGYQEKLLLSLICDYKFMSPNNVKEIFKSLTNHKLILEFIDNNVKVFENNNTFMFDLILNHNIYLYTIEDKVTNPDVIEFAVLGENFDSSLWDLYNRNFKMNIETKYIIYQFLINDKKYIKNFVLDKDELHNFIKDLKREIRFREKEIIKSLPKNLAKFIKQINYKSDTSLIQITDDIGLANKTIDDNDRFFTIDERIMISIKPENFDLIANQNKSTIKYGMYPINIVDNYEEKILDLLYSNKQLNACQTNYTFMYHSSIYTTKIYMFNNNKYVRIKYGKKYKWLKIEPLIWKINRDNKSLDLESSIIGLSEFNEYNLNSFLTNFKKQVFEPYVITNEEKVIKDDLDEKKEIKSTKFKLDKALHEDEKKKNESTDQYKKVLIQLAKIQESLDDLEVQNLINSIGIRYRIGVSEEVLIIKVEDHYEFNPEFIPFLKYIDLSLVSSENLKVNGIDWSQTNLRIDPQKVYKKDLSNCILSDDNIVFKSFDGVNLSGTNIENETESAIEIDKAIIDDNTKLPNIKNKSL